MKKEKKIIFVLVFLGILILGCVEEKPKEDKKLTHVQGIDIVGEFKSTIDKIAMGREAYIMMIVRNNAAGAAAKDISISLENVEPFKIVECDGVHDASDRRTGIKECSTFFDDIGKPYKEHFLEEMFPNEEIEVIWVLKAPNSTLLGNMYYSHPLYYVIRYNYKKIITQNIVTMSKSEYYKRTQEEKNWKISGETISTAGEITVNSLTTQPLIYDKGSKKTDFTLSLEISNSGRGVPVDRINITIQIPQYVSIGDLSGTLFRRLKSEELSWFKNEFPEIICKEDGSDLIIAQIDASNVANEPLRVHVPLSLQNEYIFEPMKTFIFKIFINYNYAKEGRTYLDVFPLKR